MSADSPWTREQGDARLRKRLDFGGIAETREGEWNGCSFAPPRLLRQPQSEARRITEERCPHTRRRAFAVAATVTAGRLRLFEYDRPSKPMPGVAQQLRLIRTPFRPFSQSERSGSGADRFAQAHQRHKMARAGKRHRCLVRRAACDAKACALLGENYDWRTCEAKAFSTERPFHIYRCERRPATGWCHV